MELKNIAKTLLLPLKARALAHINPNVLFEDNFANNIWEKVNVSFTEGTEVEFIKMIVARTQLFDRMLQDALLTKQSTLVVNLGAGLCTREQRFTSVNHYVNWLYVDVEEVVNLRKNYFGNKEYTKALNLKNTNQWIVLLKEIFDSKLDLILFIAEGVFSYFTEQEFTHFTEKIIEQVKLSNKKVSFCFDCSHPNYAFKTAFSNVDAFEDVSFSKNFKNTEALVSSLTIKPVVKKYRLPFNVVDNIDYHGFVTSHQGEEPYYAAKLDFNTVDTLQNILGTYFENTLQLNTAYSQTFLNNGMCFFNTNNNFYVLNTQDWIKLKSYLEDSVSFALSFDEIQIFYNIEKLIDLKILVECNHKSYDNVSCLKETHFFPNKFWADNKIFQNIIDNYQNKNVALVFTHNLYDTTFHDYVNKVLNNKKKCCVVVLEDHRILISPLFTNITYFNLYIDCILINAPQLVWANKQTDQKIDIPCPVDVNLKELDAVWLFNYLKEPLDTLKITEYVYENKSVDKHSIADYKTLEKSTFLSSNKEFIVDKSSGFRTKKSTEILKDCKSQISTVSGVISEPKIIANLSNQLVTYNCTYPTRIHFESFENKLFFNQSLGKGLHKEQSEISAIAEAFERFSMNYNGKEDCFIEKYVTDDNYVNPLSLFTFSEEQYKDGNYDKLQENSPIYWTQGISLTENKKKYLPAVLCFQNAPFKERKNLRFSSNGCATGNTVKEAILQGLLELIERDAVALWWYQKRKCSEVDVSKHQTFINLIETKGWKVWVLDVTTDIEIPVMVAIAQHNITNEFRLGFGAHLDWDITIARAISEVHQIIEVAEFAKAEFDFSKIKSESYLIPHGIKYNKELVNITTLDEAIDLTKNKIEKQGFDILYKNLSRNNLALKTVKVFVPGLCFIWPEFGNKRLYKNSHGENCFTEDELNPLELFV